MIKALMLALAVSHINTGSTGSVEDNRFTTDEFECSKEICDFFGRFTIIPEYITEGQDDRNHQDHLGVTTIFEPQIVRILMNSESSCFITTPRQIRYYIGSRCAITMFYDCLGGNAARWRLASISDFNANMPYNMLLADLRSELCIFNGKIRPNLRLANLSGVGGHFSSSKKSRPQQPRRDEGKKRHDPLRDSIPLTRQRPIPERPPIWAIGLFIVSSIAAAGLFSYGANRLVSWVLRPFNSRKSKKG